MFNKGLSSSWLILTGLSITIALTGCSSLVDAPISDTQTPALNNQIPSDVVFEQCPPFDAENTICTAQYEPVCVKTQVGSIVSYSTASNACSACSTSEAIGYSKGECN